MPFDPNCMLRIVDGKLTDENYPDLVKRRIEAGDTPVVLHFHGGLVPSKDWPDHAEKLRSVYEKDDACRAIFPVWHTGIGDVLPQVLDTWTRDTFFDHALKYLEGFFQTFAPDSHKKRSISRDVTGLLNLPSETLTAVELEISGTGAEKEAKQIREALSSIDKERELDNAWEEVLTAYREKTKGSEANRLSTEPSVRVSQDIVKDALEETGNVELKAKRPLGATSMTLALLLTRTLRGIYNRFRDGTHHGLHATIIEEVLATFYVGKLGTDIWSEMKWRCLRAFTPQGQGYAGEFLFDLFDNLKPGRRIVLIGHSAGAIFISRLLSVWRESGRDINRFEVIFLAPAVRWDVFYKALDGRPLENFRLFTMAESNELASPLLGRKTKAVYPSSLLYLISGLLETHLDLDGRSGRSAGHPILGLEKFTRANVLNDDDFQEWVRRSTALSRTDGQGAVGWLNNVLDHGGFDDITVDGNENCVLSSIRHIIQAGF